MRILFWGVAPWARTGYGTGCRYLTQHLAELGHQVAIFAYAGCQYGDTEWTGPLGHTIPVYGNPLRSSQVYVEQAAKKWKADLVLAWFDLWPIAALLGSLTLPRLVAYTPVDSTPVAGLLAQGLASAKVVVPFCDFGAKQIRKVGISCTDPIYHGCDTSLYSPRAQAESRATFGLPDGPLFLTVKANNGERANLPGHLRAFRPIADRAHYWMWTYPHMDNLNPEAFDLEGMWDSLDGPRGRIMLPDPWTYLEGLPDERMPEVYSAADWLVNCTMGEGFGFPIIEAMACGVPVICSDWSSMPELVGSDRGLLVPTGAWFACQATYAWQAIPDEVQFTLALEEALDIYPKERRAMGLRGRRWVKENCDWRVVARQWDTLLRSL